MIPERNEIPPYEPPQVEAILTAAELAREIHYAGVVTLLDG
jgi:hypothetical protein